MTLPKTITGGLLLLFLLLVYLTLRQVPVPPVPAPELPILKLDPTYKESAMGMLEQVRRGEPLGMNQLALLGSIYRNVKEHSASDADEVEELLTLILMILDIQEQLTDGGYPRPDPDDEAPGGSN